MTPLVRLLVLALIIGGPIRLAAQSASIQLSDNFIQTSASTPAEVGSPFVFTAHLRHGNPGIDISAWGPQFYLPGTSQTPGSPNFPGSPNNGSDFLFTESFATSSALFSAYPTGSYGLVFTGVTPPPEGSFTAGLAFTNGGFAAVAPKVTSMNNGATWSTGLVVGTTGTTLLDINTSAFTEYGAGVGAFAIAGLYDSLGNVVTTIDSFYVPSLSLAESLFTQFSINGALLTSGSNYTLDIQYGILGSAPGSATLNGNTFDGTSAYYMNTRINIAAVPEPGTFALVAGGLAVGCVAWRRRRVHAK